MLVEVVRSSRRRKTVELRPTPEGVRISIPGNATAAEEEKYVAQLLRRYKRRQQSSAIDLADRSHYLASLYDLPAPRSIRWVENQTTRWGSCTPFTSTIRISSVVAKFPGWVLDYVILHEMAHLIVFDHNQEFWDLVERYPKTERARGFLIAKGLDGASKEDEQDEDVDLSMDNDASEVEASSTLELP